MGKAVGPSLAPALSGKLRRSAPGASPSPTQRLRAETDPEPEQGARQTLGRGPPRRQAAGEETAREPSRDDSHYGLVTDTYDLHG